MRVQIPKNVKYMYELPNQISPEDRYELFEQYTMAIWHFQCALDKLFNWGCSRGTM